MAKLALHFLSGSTPQLDRVEYWQVSSPESRRVSIRGVGLGKYHATGSFPYSAGVRAFSALVLGTKLANLDGQAFSLVGETGSLAASLDYAIAKKNLWLQDMFGVTQDGTLIARRLLGRVNPERKRAGPVAIYLNVDHLPVENISISLGSTPVLDRDGLEFLLGGRRVCRGGTGRSRAC